jgi:hypothetical protein
MSVILLKIKNQTGEHACELANRELTRYCCSLAWDIRTSPFTILGADSCVRLSEQNFIKDLQDYPDSVHGRIPYYDITAFHESDSDLAAEFLEIERRERNNKPSYPG